jgi:hypothetical protein
MQAKLLQDLSVGSILPHSSTLQMEAIYSFEASSYLRTTYHYNPEGCTLNSHRPGNIKFNISALFSVLTYNLVFSFVYVYRNRLLYANCCWKTLRKGNRIIIILFYLIFPKYPLQYIQNLSIINSLSITSTVRNVAMFLSADIKTTSRTKRYKVCSYVYGLPLHQVSHPCLQQFISYRHQNKA